MATAAAIRWRIYQNLYNPDVTDRPFEDTLGELLDSSETDVDVSDGTNWDVNDILEVEETGEQMLVRSIATNTLTVKRGVRGTTAAATTDASGIVYKNPRFTQKMVDDAAQSVMDYFTSWGVHAFSTGSITLVASQWYYEINKTDLCDPYNILSVYYIDTNTNEPVGLPFNYYHPLSTSGGYSQAQGIRLRSVGDRNAGDDLLYTYAKRIGATTDLDTPQEELVVLGATALLLGMTIAPLTQDPGARTNRSVPPGQTARDGRWFQGEFFIKVRAEAARLAVVRQQFPGNVRTKRAGRWRS